MNRIKQNYGTLPYCHNYYTQKYTKLYETLVTIESRECILLFVTLAGKMKTLQNIKFQACESINASPAHSQGERGHPYVVLNKEYDR